MEGLGRAVGAGTTLTLGGITYRLSPVTIDDLGEIEHHIVASRQNPVDMVKKNLDGLDPDHQVVLLKMAYEDLKAMTVVTDEQLNVWMDSREGATFTMWIMIRGHLPEMTLEKVTKLVNEELRSGQEEFWQQIIDRRDLVSGMGELGNSTGLSRSDGEAGAKSESLGAASSSS